MLKQQLSLKQQQKLAPQQILVIKLLEVPTMELEERILQELEENPALEEGREDPDESQINQEGDLHDDYGVAEDQESMVLGDYLTEDDIPDYRLQANNHSSDTTKTEIPYSEGESFHEFLFSQLGLTGLNEREYQIGQYIIGNIDQEGYLRRDLLSISDDLAFQLSLEVSEQELLRLLRIIQQFDPPGVGATTLQETLLIQLHRKDSHGGAIRVAIRIIEDCFEEFSKKHYDRIEKRLSVSQELIKAALDEIVKLSPKPGSAWSSTPSNSDHIIPDFLVEIDDKDLILSLNNRNIPELRVASSYKEMFQDYLANRDNQTKQMKEAVLFVKQKLDAAQGFIEAIKQRQNTLLTVMQAIVDRQKEFFLSGDERDLKPMILKDIADKTLYDISTISRVSSSKYVQTEFGVYPVKYFFSESMQTDTGEEVSSREIKKILQDCIGAENKLKPLTDDALAEMLKQKGYIIARRTVAKYREQLGLPVARLRKEI